MRWMLLYFQFVGTQEVQRAQLTEVQIEVLQFPIKLGIINVM